MFEAVVNSFQSVEDAGEILRTPKIEIIVSRDPVLPAIEADTDVHGFKVIAVGLIEKAAELQPRKVVRIATCLR